MHHSEIMVQKQSGCPIGESIPQTSAVCRLVSFQGMTTAGLLSCHSWSLIVSWEVESCWGTVLRFWRVILHGEARTEMHSQ
jgi:hypothetical protein